MTKSPYKVLLIAEAANPDWASVPLIGWSMSYAIKKLLPNAHIVTQVRNKAAILKTGLLKENDDFTLIDSEKVAIVTNRISSFIRGNSGKGWTFDTAISVISYYYFEHLVWRKFGNRIINGEFDIVHRVTPVSPTSPSLLAKKCFKAKVPFIIGPLNGGVPWPKEFAQIRHKENEWLSYIRDAYKLLPGYRSTLKYSSALIAGSKFTLNAFPKKYQTKSFYVPENGIDPDRFSAKSVDISPSKKIGICFVGRMVPYKGADMLLEACLPLLKSNKITLDFIGDGPILCDLKVKSDLNEVNDNVTFHGWIPHKDVQTIMCKNQILGFPSVREFGGGVILEAMSLGVIPIVIDYAGPGELVDSSVGYKVALGSKENIVSQFRKIISNLVEEREKIKNISIACKLRIQEKYTWETKSEQILKIYEWVLNEDPAKIKPDFFELN